MEYKKIFLGYENGIKKVSNRVYLSPPSWDCGWYWGFGYLGNARSHYHVDGLKDNGNHSLNLYDALILHFGDTLRVNENDLWTFAELFQSFYNLKLSAETLGQGGAYLSNNPSKEDIKQNKAVEHINKISLPSIFNEIYKILDNYKK